MTLPKTPPDRPDPMADDKDAPGNSSSTRQAAIPASIPIVEERLAVGRETVETGRVRVTSRVVEEPAIARTTMVHSTVRIERRPIDTIVAALPPVREEPDRVVVPVVEEVLVRRWRVLEEIHLVTERREQDFEEEVLLRRTEVSIERTGQPAHEDLDD